MSRMIRTRPQNDDDSFPCSPSQRPAMDRSLHGNDAVNRRATRHVIRLDRVNVADDKMVVVRPVVPVHLGLLGVNVVGENDTPPLPLKGEPHETDAGKKLRAFQYATACSDG